MTKSRHSSIWKNFLYLLGMGLALTVVHTARAADYSTAPGGFMENDTTGTARAAVTASHVSLPSSRGSFTFPAPYGTHGVRVTVPSDCGGQDCLDMTYNYWKNMSNSAGSDTMYVFIGLDKARGGQGPTLFKYTKSTGALSEVGPLFPASNPLSDKSTEGWYFSYGMPTKIYLQEGSKLERYDVLSHTTQTVFDSTTKYPGTVIHQTNSSNDDDVHSATLEDASTFKVEGCLAYKESTKHFYYFAANGKFDECQIDKGGQYLEIKEKLPQDPCTSCDEDDLIVDLATGKQQVLLDKNGAGGHSDLGYGAMVASDNWNTEPNAWRVWQFGQSSLQGDLVYRGGTWGEFAPSHVSWANASEGTPLSQQYVCGAAAVTTSDQRDNDVQCFTLGGGPTAQLQSLIVAPVMTSVSATGGSGPCPNCLAYGQDPKGNLDPTGQYFFWVSNMGGSRMDAFMVQVPTQVMGISGGGVTITSPKDGADINGALDVTASVASSADVAQVIFKVDGGSATSSLSAPYAASWPAGALSSGTHTLTAEATDTNGHTETSAPVTITVGGSAGGSGAGGGGSGGGGAVSLVGLVAFVFFGLWRKLVRQLERLDMQTLET